LIDFLSEYLARRKGLLPFVGMMLVVVNLALQLISAHGWVASSNLLLHLGIVIAILGLMLAWAL
jgi:hypothetical protein